MGFYDFYVPDYSGGAKAPPWQPFGLMIGPKNF
nr:MAG TPA: hypothetical protein [Caudoviricetes sp.]